jgi:hypothetical protein
MSTRRRRWSDNDHNFLIFTYAHSLTYRPLAVILSSADDEDEDEGCNLRLSAFGHTLIIRLPPLIRPWTTKVKANWDAATIERLGRDWYYNVEQRSYGFSLAENHLCVSLGRVTNDSTTTQSWSMFLPWNEWRVVRRTLCGADGMPFWTSVEKDRQSTSDWYAELRQQRQLCPSLKYHFKDYDDEEIIVSTQIEEMEWHRGVGRFKWMSWFSRPKIRRSLMLEFTKEVGTRKGSWKGGTTGHSIELSQTELHEAAFRRYCDNNNMTFIGPVSDSKTPLNDGVVS